MRRCRPALGAALAWAFGIALGLLAQRGSVGVAARGAAPPSAPLANLARQVDRQACGPGALAFVLLALGRETTPEVVRSRLPQADLPWSLADLSRAADASGLCARLVELGAVAWPGWHILHLELAGAGHFVAARRLPGGELEVFDPASGALAVVDEARLQEAWTGAALWVEAERVPGGGRCTRSGASRGLEPGA